MSTVAPSFIWVADDGAMIRFPRKRKPSVSTTHVIWTRIRGVEELEVQKNLKSAVSSRRNKDLPDAPVIKPTAWLFAQSKNRNSRTDARSD
jgi:hypothetical protein